MVNLDNSRQFWKPAVLLGLAICVLLAVEIWLVRQDRAALVQALATERQQQLELAAQSSASALGDVADTLALAREFLSRPGPIEQQTRELNALLVAVAQDRAIAVFDGAGQVRMLQVDDHVVARPELAAYEAVLVEFGKSTHAQVPGPIAVSSPLAPPICRGCRIFSMPLDAPAGGGSVAIVVDTEPFFAPIQVLGHGATTQVLVLGPGGRVAPFSSPGFMRWFEGNGGAPAEPGARDLVERSRAQESGFVVLPEETAASMGLGLNEAVANYAPVSLKRVPSWRVITVTSTSALRAQERQLLAKAGLGVLLISLILAGFTRYVYRASQRATALLESQRQAARLGQILDHIPAGVVVLDARGGLVGTNHSLRQKLGATSSGARLAALFPAAADLGGRLDVLVEGAIASGQMRSLLGEVAPLFGREGQYNLYAVPLDEGDPEARALLVVEDLSNIRALEFQLLRAEKLATVGVLAAGIAHEIGTPLSVVRGRAEYIHKKIGAESPHAAGLSVIVEQIDRVSRTLRQLLDFSRLRPGVVQPVEAEGAFQAVRELLQLEFERRELTLDIAVPAGLPPFSADPDQLQQVIINLVFNACDASSPGGHVKLTAFHEQTGGAWGTTCFSVEDFGAGIAPEHLTQIFDPFFTTKKRGQGTGLGLTIVDQIVRNHSGRIEVASQVGRGTRLTVHWPSAARSQG